MDLASSVRAVAGQARGNAPRLAQQSPENGRDAKSTLARSAVSETRESFAETLASFSSPPPSGGNLATLTANIATEVQQADAQPLQQADAQPRIPGTLPPPTLPALGNSLTPAQAIAALVGSAADAGTLPQSQEAAPTSAPTLSSFAVPQTQGLLPSGNSLLAGMQLAATAYAGSVVSAASAQSAVYA